MSAEVIHVQLQYHGQRMLRPAKQAPELTFMIIRRGRTGFRDELRSAAASSSPYESVDNSELMPMLRNASHMPEGVGIFSATSLSKDTTAKPRRQISNEAMRTRIVDVPIVQSDVSGLLQ